MSTSIARITDKIVEVTNNPNTSKFVGAVVTKRDTAQGVVYAIGKTGYVLTKEEFRYFYKLGAIALEVVKTASRVMQPKQTKNHKADMIAPTHTAHKKVTRKQANETFADAEMDTVESSYSFGQNTDALMNSSFLQNWEATGVQIKESKHAGFFDKLEDAGNALTGMFDFVGKKGRDHLINSMEDDK